MAALQLRTSDGQLIEFEADRNATVADTRRALIDNHAYSEHVRVMYAGKILRDENLVLDYPRGTLIVVGQPKPRAAPPSANRAPPSYGHATQPTHQNATPNPSAARGRPQAQSAPQHSQSPARDLTKPMTVIVLVPASNNRLELRVPPTATLADLTALARRQAPELAAAKIIFRGKLLPDHTKELRQLGIQDGMTLHAAAGALADPNAILLLQVAEEVDKVRVALPAAQGQVLKGLHEQLMRLLFRLDDLTEVNEQLRARRKALVRDIQELQDRINATS